MEKKIWNRVLKLKPHLESSTFALLSKYKARSSFAIGLRNTPNENLGTDTSEAYFVVLKLSLVYSALELLEGATGNSKGIHVRNSHVAYALANGRFAKLLKQIEESTPKTSLPKVLKTIESLTSKDSSVFERNLFPFVALCRNLMFHGSFSPSGSGLLNSRENRELLLGLAFTSIRAGDLFLDAWLTKTAVKINRTLKK